MVALDMLEHVRLNAIVNPADIKVWLRSQRDTILSHVVLLRAMLRWHQLYVLSASPKVQLLGHLLHEWVDRIHQVEYEFVIALTGGLPTLLLFLSCLSKGFGYGRH